MSTHPHTFKIIPLPESRDERGALVHVERTDLPFDLKRVFWIYGVPEGRTRGGHAHHSQAEIIIPVRGSFSIFVDDGHETASFRMDSPRQGIYIGPDVWSELSLFSADCVCVVLCSEPYDHTGYVATYDEFKRLHR